MCFSRLAAATSVVKKEDCKGMYRGPQQSTSDGTQKVWRLKCGNAKNWVAVTMMAAPHWQNEIKS
jgi:hypothetical protein